VLDMCSAPGGKSICILQRLCLPGDPTVQSTKTGRLHCNEMSQDRRTRLRKVLKEYLPTQVFETSMETSALQITGQDATKRDAFFESTYDKVLCDAPCSSERHVLHDPDELSQWTPGRTKNSAKRQVLLLMQALRAVKEAKYGGRVVYATCSLSRFENDLVVERAMAKSKFVVRVITKEVNKNRSENPMEGFGVGESTGLGWIVLPDTGKRWGPLYFCVLEKVGIKAEYADREEDEDYDGA
ncbi:NOL1/NOP2/Sun domain member 3, partial [Blyttiomyces sp. JEL0837]